MYYSVLDTIMSCIKDRFVLDDYKMCLTLEQRILKGAKGQQCEEEIEKVTGFYQADFDIYILRVLLKTAQSIINADSVERFETF